MLIAVGLFMFFFASRRNKEEQKGNKKASLWPCFIATVLAIAAIVLFVLTSDVTLRMELVDSWTIWHLVICAVSVVFMAIGVARAKSNKGVEERA
jgi:H+/Cl- antiporter ClcA